jgi:guanylate kinase
MGEPQQNGPARGRFSVPQRKKKRPALLVVLSSPSGGGKTVICRHLLRRDPEFMYSVSVTTRPPRVGEVDGKHYHFVTAAQFQRLIAANRLAEYATVHGHMYGTPQKNIKEAIAQRRVILFDLDVVGGLSLKRQYQEAVLVFLVPPSWEVLKSRLAARKTESAADLRRRLARSRRELPFWRYYDYVVTNDRLTDSVAACLAIIRAERLRSVRAPDFPRHRAVPLEKLEG